MYLIYIIKNLNEMQCVQMFRPMNEYQLKSDASQEFCRRKEIPIFRLILSKEVGHQTQGTICSLYFLIYQMKPEVEAKTHNRTTTFLIPISQ